MIGVVMFSGNFQSDKNGDKTHRHVQLPASNQRSCCQNRPDFDAIEVMEDDKDFEVIVF